MSTRVDSWIWGIRLTKTRSAAGAACRGGHVHVNGVTAKASTAVSVGDRVQVQLHGRQRIVEVTKLISKRVSAAAAAECYIDHSPPPPPREVIASIPRRDPGAGRPTKRERRQLDRLRTGPLLIGLAAAAALLLTGCGGGDDGGAQAAKTTTVTPKAGSGPQFSRCAGLTTEQVTRESGLRGLQLYIDNPSVCEWRVDSGRSGGTVSFNWYRGSPIGRERANEQLSRIAVEKIDIGGQSGFIAHTDGICEIGIDYGADFFELSASLGLADSADATDRLCDGARRLAEAIVENGR